MTKPNIAATAAVLLVAAAFASEPAHWEYAGATGPAHWAELSPNYHACAGANQSPIDLAGMVDADLPPIRFDYSATGTEVVNNGHTIQVAFASGASIDLDGRTFALRQFHFHAPSENLIGGESFPMEAHLVHADSDGKLVMKQPVSISATQLQRFTRTIAPNNRPIQPLNARIVLR